MLAKRSFLKLLISFSIGQIGVSSGIFSKEPAFAKPKGKIILTIDGETESLRTNGAATFDLPMLERLPRRSFKTKTPWFTDTTEFEGVLLKDLLTLVGAQGATLTATALNDYSVSMPTSDLDKFDVLLAYKRDGAYMPVSDKGPLFIVYPFDSDANLHSQKYYSRSVWQLNRLIVK